MDILEVFKKFPKQEDCISYLEQVRWGGTPRCPYCHSDNSTSLSAEQRHHCNNCNTSYSVTVKTIFHQTHLPLQKWFLAVSLILNAKKGIAARQLARDLDVHRNTAWRISMKVREAMGQKEHRELLTGMVEMDETWIGARKPRHEFPGDKHPRGLGTSKTPVVGMVEREDGGQVYAKVAKKQDLNAKKTRALVRDRIDTGEAVLVTDENSIYLLMRDVLPHKMVNHKVWYVAGDAHTNTIESFWSLLKRGIVGQFHKVSLRHLPRYVDEFCYRYNHRRHADLFGLTIARGLGVA
ncbi:MAG: IS1595 family transposase [Candidatus Bipolaricaulota bacterium]|nr:IS1595 family transposase [Candidatus Bipolaricaulota bacterium]